MTVQAAGLPMSDAELLPTSAMSESQLVEGYGGLGIRLWPVAIEPCACGERIVAISRRPDDVLLAVRAHNASTVHQQWRRWQQDGA